ncbi:unnamed protein product [Schistocephalus solidus]|uniref:Down syndrome cell adhesion molecule-like protein Dscam2 n=1 Tax=Schistocephalus solidus TaxID=70667 RepID=A0A3P7EDP2_SCHSO|nr:unnamed protein product [Schistocephalus solidus]
MTYSCAVQNYADKPWYAWWQFQPEGTNEVINLPPKSQQNPRAFQVAYAADTHQTKRWVLPDPLKGQVPSFVEDKPNSVVHVLIEPLDKQEHQGTLTCKIMNSVGFEERSIRVTFIPEFEFDIRPPNKQDVILAQNISINCTARPSELVPMIVWKYSDESTGDLKELSSLTERTDGRIYQKENGTLVISQVEESDPRKFLCFLTPKESSTATPISVAVNLEVRGSKFNLTCIVHGDANQLRAEWHYRASPKQNWRLIDQPCVVPASLQEEPVLAPPFENVDFLTDPDACHNLAAGRFESGVVFRQVSAFKPNGRGMERQLQFDSLKDVHMGEYMCRASNLYNLDSEGNRVEVEEQLRLTVISAPDPVMFVQNSSRTSATTISFAWQPPAHDGNKPIKMYSIRYYQPDAAVDSPNQGVSPIMNVGGTSHVRCSLLHGQHDMELTGLPKFTTYAIRVIAINSKGLSPPAFALARTLEDLPQAPPTNVTCSTQQHSITVSWDPPDFETVNGILTEYLVNYYIANDFGDETHSVNQVVKGQTTVTLAGLLANTNYTVQVAASNRKGRGPLSPRKSCFTTEAAPDAPEKVKAMPYNESCVMVSWSHPSRPQGVTRFYCIYAIRQTGGSHARLREKCVPPDFSKPYNYYLYCNLELHVPYNISVLAKNRFDGRPASIAPVSPAIDLSSYRFSDVINLENGTLLIEAVKQHHSGQYVCEAREDSISYDLKVQDPPKPPVFHKLTPSLRNIQVEWLSPGSRRLDAPIRWFHLNWTNEHTGETGAVALPADKRTYYLSKLTCATTVRFQIRAENQMGNSSLTDPISARTDGSAPLFVENAEMVPLSLRHQTAVTFNLSVFTPGHNCSPSAYQVRVWPAGEAVPIESTSNRLARASFFNQPAIIVPLTVILVFLLVICVGILFYCRHRRFEAELQPTKPAAVLASGGGRDFVGRPIGGDASMKKAPLRSGAHRGTLPPIPTNEKAQYTPGQRSSGLWGLTSLLLTALFSWLGTRPRVYDRGRSGAPLPQQPLDEDQRSNSSMDSTGSLNPYATYEAGGIKETVPQASVASVIPTAPTAVGVAGKVGRTMTRAHEAPVVPTLPGGAGATRSYQAFTEGHRGFPGFARQQSYMHQYHYPNLETAEEDGRLKHPRFVRVGSGRLTGPCGTRDAIRNRMIAQNALLDPPVQQPYVNNTLEEEEEEEEDENMDFADPSRHHPMGRRVNSLESLQQIFRQGSLFLLLFLYDQNMTNVFETEI